MRKFIITSILCLPFCAMAQIPVTDVAGGAILTSINIQAVLRNKLLTKQVANQQRMIMNQKTIINLLRKGNNIVKHTDELKTEEIETYKKAPDQSIIQYQLYDLEKIKDDIVASAKGFLQVTKSLDHIEAKELAKFTPKVAELVEGTVMAWKQTKKLLASRDRIIPARERQELLQTTIESLRSNVGKIKGYQDQLIIANKKRASREQIFGSNK